MSARVGVLLRAPVGGSRPTFGLLAAAFAELADVENVIGAILTGAGVQSGLLQILNDGAPLAERAVSVPVPLCLALDGEEGADDDATWPGESSAGRGFATSRCRLRHWLTQENRRSPFP